MIVAPDDRPIVCRVDFRVDVHGTLVWVEPSAILDVRPWSLEAEPNAMPYDKVTKGIWSDNRGSGWRSHRAVWYPSLREFRHHLHCFRFKEIGGLRSIYQSPSFVSLEPARFQPRIAICTADEHTGIMIWGMLTHLGHRAEHLVNLRGESHKLRLLRPHLIIVDAEWWDGRSDDAGIIQQIYRESEPSVLRGVYMPPDNPKLQARVRWRHRPDQVLTSPFDGKELVAWVHRFPWARALVGDGIIKAGYS